MNPAFWAGRRVFLTGHTGFKGSWLSLWLEQLGASVTGYALPPPTKPSLFEMAGVGNGMKSVIGDVRDLTSLRAAMTQAEPEIVIHMAAQPLVRLSYENPADTYSTNVMGTVHLLESVRQTPSVRAVVNVTTDKCYENKEWVWGYRETDPMGGFDPYSSSKGCAELVSAAYRSSFFSPHGKAQAGIALATARAGNVIGGGDWAQDRLIPDIIKAFEHGHPAIIRSPHAIRPWQHVLEPLCGYLTLAEKLFADGPPFAEAWNFGPADQDAQAVAWIVEQLAQLWGEGAAYHIDVAAANLHEAHYLKLDCSKARMRLGWQARWELRHTLRKICEWHKALQAGGDMRALTLQQIREYESASESESG